ncbi:MAG TPA: hypothetical protein VGE72_27605 [Azospirillum sp.]
MTTRNGDAVEGQADSPIPSKDKSGSPLVARYPMIAFSFNADASRLVLLYRDPSTGSTVDQIPSETALKQYEEAQKKEDRRKRLEVIVGGAAEETGNGTSRSRDGAGPAAMFGVTPGVATGATTTASAPPAYRADGAAAQTVGPAPVSTPSTTSAGGGAPHVNVVI